MDDPIGDYLDYARAITYLAQDGVRAPPVINGVKLNRDSIEYFLCIGRHNDEKHPQIDNRRLKMAFGTRSQTTICQLTKRLIDAGLIQRTGGERDVPFILTEEGKRAYKRMEESLASLARDIGFRVL